MATPAEQHMNKIKDLLLGQDVSGQVELLLNLLSDAAAGKELSNVVSEVIQVCDLIWILILLWIDCACCLACDGCSCRVVQCPNAKMAAMPLQRLPTFPEVCRILVLHGLFPLSALHQMRSSSLLLCHRPTHCRFPASSHSTTSAHHVLGCQLSASASALHVSCIACMKDTDRCCEPSVSMHGRGAGGD